MPVDPVLRVEPGRLPELVEAYTRAIDMLTPHITNIGLHGRIEEPWAADPTSIAVADHYNHEVIDSPYSTYQALVRYEEQLITIRDTLADIARRYADTEGEIAIQWRTLP